MPSAAAEDPADLSVTKTDSADPVAAGSNITYTIMIDNDGPDPATGVVLTEATPANTTFVSISPAAGCTTPAVGGTGSISCPVGTLADEATATFALVVNVNPATASGTVISNTASVSSAVSDPISANNTDTETTVVGTGSGADLSVTKTDSSDPVAAAANLSYTIVVHNNGPLTSTATLTDAVPATTTFVSMSPAAGCSLPAVGGTGTVTCPVGSLSSGGTASYTMVVNVTPGTSSGTTITNTASVASGLADPVSTNNSDVETTTVGLASTLCTITGTKQSDTINGTSGNDVICGGNGKDTINGLAGDDVILGQNGKDSLNGGDGVDTLMGGNGKDSETGGAGFDVLRGGNGKDTLNAQDGAAGDSVIGGNGNDTCPVDAGDLEDCP
jgi:uncharacterized repeat protein (TIGR01451 family)